jgi:hypothetical protein
LVLLCIGTSRDRTYQCCGDFQAFYNAGLILNSRPERLYDLEAQHELYVSQGGEEAADLPFLYPPFFALPCGLVARLPYVWGYFAWIIASLLLFSAGYLLVGRTWGVTGLVAALAFPPFEFYVMRGAQVTAFGFFALALAFYLNRSRRSVAAGIALSLLLYKPPLLLFLLPMLFLTRQWRMLSGFAVGSSILAVISFGLVGRDGIAQYINVLKLFSVALNSSGEIIQTYKYVDINAAFRLLTGVPIGMLRFFLLAGTLPFLCLAWLRAGNAPLSWAISILATLLLGVYSPIYDCAFLVLVATWSTPRLRWLVGVFIISAVTEPFARATGLQLFTFVLACGLAFLVRSARPTLCAAVD